MTLLSWWHQVPFGGSDPILGHDAGFYVFTLPLLELVRGLLLGLVVLAAVGVGGALFLRRRGGADAVRPAHRRPACAATSRGWRPRSSWCSRSARGSSRLQEIVSPSGIIQGASYTDVHARMPAALALAAAALVGAALAVADGDHGPDASR